LVDADFFLAPQHALHRQYEALRAYFVEQRSSKDAAALFGYSPGAFRVLCHQFRHEPHRREFFRDPRHGPHNAPARDAVRELAVAMRKRNMSVYDIQRELASSGHAISVNALSVLLREEGFARLPRRRDDERPAALKPESAAIADVRQLDLSPRSFRTSLAGLFVFVPLLQRIDMQRVVAAARLPSSQMIPAACALRSLLALKLLGKERKSHVMDLVFDQAIALFAGLNCVPKRSYLSEYSSRVDDRTNQRLMDAWFGELERGGFAHGDSLDLDFHSVPANSTAEPLEKHYVSSRSRRQKGILVFLARDAEQRVLRYAQAGIPKAEQADEILSFVKFWKSHTGTLPAELVFDSQLTTHGNLSRLNAQGIRFITLRRRSRKMLSQIFATPASAWRRITLNSLTRTYRTPRVLDQTISLDGYKGTLRQMTVIDLGHEEPTVLLTNNLQISAPALVTRYAQRMLIENKISEAIQFFHIDSLSSMVGLKVDFDLQLTLMASSLYRMLAGRIGREYARAQPKTIFRNLLDLSGTVTIDDQRIAVRLDKRAHDPYLVASGILDKPSRVPWLGPDGHFKFLHLWPPQTPPGRTVEVSVF
jgi:hypothetical protein